MNSIRFPVANTCQAVAFAAMLAIPVAAQCDLQWALPTTSDANARVTMSNGDVVVGADGPVAGTSIPFLARYDGQSWSTVGGGLNGAVLELGVQNNGDLVALGTFTTAGGVPVPGVATWDGSSWQPHPGGPVPPASHYCVLPNGNLAAGLTVSSSPFNAVTSIDLFDGTSWQQIGTGTGSSTLTPSGSIVDLAALPSGELVAVGTWNWMWPIGSSISGHELVTWNGVSWDEFYSMPDPISFEVTARGEGMLVFEDGFALWDGQTWTGPGFGMPAIHLPYIGAATQLPNGDVLLGGAWGPNYSTIPPQFGCLRYNRANGTFDPLGAQVGSAWGSIDRLFAFPDGRVFVGGAFQSIGGVVNAHAAELVAPCPSMVSSSPTTCVGPVGPLTLNAEALPWLGSDWRSRCEGFASSSLAVHVLGVSSVSVPLTVLPQGLPNCNLRASGELVELAVPTGGESTFSFALPSDPVFVGMPLFQQSLQLGFTSGGQFASISASNLLTLNLGFF